MNLTNNTARALRFAARLADRAVKGTDLGDSIAVETLWSGAHSGKAEVELHVWHAGEEESVAERLLKIRKALGGSFDKNDPSASPFDDSYAKLSRVEEDFVVSITTSRNLTCERKVISVEIVHHEAREAYDEERPVVEWDCTPLNNVVALAKAAR